MKTIEIKSNKILNKKGFGADTEINRGKSKTKSTQYLTLSQQISSMLDPELQAGNMMIDTKISRDEYANTEIDGVEIMMNKYKTDKTTSVELGREAVKMLDQRVTNQQGNKDERNNGN